MKRNEVSSGKSQLVLMCQVIMILIFALSAAACVRVFAFTYKGAQFNEYRDRAVLATQNAAELCKLSKGDFVWISRQLGGVPTESGLEVFYDENWQAADAPAAFILTVSAVDSKPGQPEKADIRVWIAEDEKELFALTVAWQEGGK